MKYIKIKSLIVVVLLLTGCEDNFLDKPPLDLYSDGNVWADPVLIEQYVNEIYGGLKSGWTWSPGFGLIGRYHLAGATDDAEVGYQWASSHELNRGDVTTANAPFNEHWADGYRTIRQTDVFFENVDAFESDDPDQVAHVERLKGEVHFLRALTYFKLMRLYGGVPIINASQGLEDDLLVSRDTYAACTDYVIDELELAFDLLPTSYTNSANIGRATRYAARALEARVQLYDERWSDAATAAKDVIDNGGYSLFPNYEGVFWEENENNQEVIFDIQYDVAAERGVYINRLNNVDSYDNGWGGTTPSQNLVDAYEMTNGLPITDLASGYDPDNPYDNRDPRLDMTVNHNGSMWRGREFEIRYDGRDAIGSHPTDATKTGYALRKWMDEDHADIKNTDAGINWIEIRLAEVLLMYAEAQNEAVGPDASVHDAVNQVRSRPTVGMPNLPAGLSQSEMRDRIRQERRVELTYEDHRYFDVRRWGIADQVLNQTIQGIWIGPNGETSGSITEDGVTQEFGVFDYESRLYLPQHRWQPIPLSEIEKNDNLEQNPGYN